MAGLTIADLPNPPLGYRPSKDSRADEGVTFESLGAALKEEHSRVARLDAFLPRAYGDEFDQAASLRNRLAEGCEDLILPRTPASFRYMRDVRNRSIGWVWYRIDQFPDAEKATACLIPANTFVSADDELPSPALLMKRLRNEFDRCDITTAPGFLFVGLDVEFDATRRLWHFHYHLSGAGEKVERLINLKTFDRFKHENRHPLEAGMPMYARIAVTRGPFNKEPNAFAYGLKNFASHHPTFLNESGMPERSKRAYALPDEQYVQWLLWRDSYKIGDFVLLSGVEVTKTGLQLTPLGKG